ncbi:PadR family transcriptional regulator [Gulosibacter molinativorax]|uniref:PadR family transcriptional regulator n=1 Tax=Gulosibacter molinativorax TaxID=256821 RepID=UPI0004075B4B|nr:PadR family transcriptional regulator [Gulosibacter molinativorax]QUY62874.1 PadR family transcriptional regulator [Gulosibacter molinativorax]
MTPPVFGHGELRLVLLTLIAQEPRHGYDLIHALNEHFEGDYSPSAGTIYPRLAKLQEEGLVTKTQDGRKTVYTITEAGRREVEQRREEFERITTERTDEVRTLAQSARAGLAQARRGLREELDQIATQARAAAEEALHRERAAAEAEATAAAQKVAERAAAEAAAKAAAAEAAGRARGVHPDDHTAPRGGFGQTGAAQPGTGAGQQGVGEPGASGPGAEQKGTGQQAPFGVHTLFGKRSAPTVPTTESGSTATGTDAPATAPGASVPGGSTGAPMAGDATGASATGSTDSTGASTSAGSTQATDPLAAAALERSQRIRRVDVALQQFRMELRQDAREANQLGGLDEEIVSELETQLRETRRRLGSLLRVHR